MTLVTRPPRVVTAGGRHAGATAGSTAASRATERSGFTRAWRRMSAPSMGRASPGTRCCDPVVVEPFHRRALVRGEPAGVGGQPDPVKLDQPDTVGPGLLQLAPQLQAGPGELDERLGVAPLVRFPG